jgi:ATP-dependent Clp endopeptidase proteolytic subunit ClpP
MRTCYTFKAAATADAADDLDIYDEIGFWGVQAKDFIASLKASSAKSINVGINSPGGDVFAGLAIYNALKGSGKTVNVKVMGIAASAASVIAMAGDTIEMPGNSMMMIHNPWTFTAGNADELREEADVLDKIGAGLTGIYANKSGQPADKIAALLAKDTWLTAAEAKELGLATVVTDDVAAKASFDLARADLPANVAAIYAAAKPKADADPVVDPDPEEDPPEPEDHVISDQVVALAKAAGLESHAAIFALACTTVDEAKARIKTAREVVALCAIAKRPDDAAGHIQKNTSVADVRAALVQAQANSDVHTSNVKPTEQAAFAAKSPKEVYAKRNARNAATHSRK